MLDAVIEVDSLPEETSRKVQEVKFLCIGTANNESIN